MSEQHDVVAEVALAPTAELSNLRYELFAQGLANGLTQQKAWRAAGFEPSNDYVRTAKRADVIARVQALLRERLANVQVTGDRVKRGLARVAFADPRKLFDENGDLLPVHLIDDDTAMAIASIEVEVKLVGRGDDAVPVTTKKIKFASRMDALGIYAKHFKLVNDDGDGVNKLATVLADRLNAAKRRAHHGVAEVEDVSYIEPEQVEHHPEPSASAGYEPVETVSSTTVDLPPGWDDAIEAAAAEPDEEQLW